MTIKPVLSFFFLFTILINCSNPVEIVEFKGVIPHPDQLSLNGGYYSMNKDIGLRYCKHFTGAADFLKSYLKHAGLKVGSGDDLVFEHDKTLADDAYELEINPGQIVIRASTDRGAFYGVQSFRQVLPVTFENGVGVPVALSVPCLKINDAPEFNYRGMHLDVGRHMYSVEFIKKYIDALAMLKMNRFHWHLTEDQGWRIEIKKYPKLQEVAAYRKETLEGHYSDQPHQFDGRRYGGYYTHEQIKEIVAYARKRFVTIIPEIEMPGHSQAALAAYPELGCDEGPVEVATKWGVFERIYCTKEETFEFLENVLDEVMELFPSAYIHIGGDEAPKTQWESCSNCQQRIKDEGLKDEHELQNYFITRIERYLNSKGRQIIGWDEILEGGLAPNATVMSWRGTSGAIAAARQQHQVVMTPTSHCYFDYYQSEHEDEPLAIGGFLPLEKVYSFNPIPEELNEEESRYVWGAQGNVWTEYMPSEDQVEYMAFPRMLAMSEVVWTNPELKNYEEFVKRVEQFHQRLEVLDINYANHLNELEGQMINQQGSTFYELKTRSDAQEIRFTLDGSDPDSNAPLYTAPIPIFKSLNLKAQVFDGDEQLGDVFEEQINFHKGVGAGISINKEPHRAYSGSGAQGLINGISGSDKRFGDKEWLGFWGEDIEIKIDLGEETRINSIATRFHNGNGQWIYSPRKVYISFVMIENIGGPEFYEIDVDSMGSLITDFKVNFEGFESSEIRIKIPNYGIIPEGRQGAGQKAWTFIDEIIIN